MWLPFIYATVLILAFVGYLYVCEREAAKGERLFLSRGRNRLDAGLQALSAKIESSIRYVIRYVITLSWYYSLHAFLKVVMKSLAGAYNVLESILIRNRDRARALRKEKKTVTVNHLTEIANHQAETKLSPSAEKRLKDNALKGR